MTTKAKSKVAQQARLNELMAQRTLNSPYSVWQRQEGVPIIEGLMIPNIRGELPMKHWARKGVPGAFIKLRGGEGSMDANVIEIPQGKHTNPEKYILEEETVVLSGRGATTVWLEGGKKHTFEWQEGSLFSLPVNAWRQHFNRSPNQPARLYSVTNAPVVFNLWRSSDFVFNNNYVFKDRFSGEEDYFSGKGEALPGPVWRSNFIPDITNFKLTNFPYSGAGGTGTYFAMANNMMQSHIAQFDVGTYKRAHRHGPGAHILILSGTGFTLMWEEGTTKKKLDWGPGSLLSPPDMWFHQHFNSGTTPARFFAVHYGYWRVVAEDMGPENEHQETGHQIAYEDEDSDVMETFLAELTKHGAKAKPIEEWRRPAQQ